MSRKRKTTKRRRRLDASMHVYEAVFETAFAPDDVVGHFVISLAAAHNDLLLTNRFLIPPDRPGRNRLTPAEQVALLRLVLSQLWETHLLVHTSYREPATAEFIDRLAASYRGDQLLGTDLVAALKGEAGATAPQFRNVLRVARNLTHHYEKPGSPKLAAALEELREEPARIVFGERMHTYRAEFADVVLFKLAFDLDEAQVNQLLGEAADSVAAVVHLAQTANDIWLAEHGGVEAASDGHS